MKHSRPSQAHSFPPQRPVVLLCRAGEPTVEAGHALEAAGLSRVINVLHCFASELDEPFQRGRLSGWRFEGLPRRAAAARLPGAAVQSAT